MVSWTFVLDKPKGDITRIALNLLSMYSIIGALPIIVYWHMHIYILPHFLRVGLI